MVCRHPVLLAFTTKLIEGALADDAVPRSGPSSALEGTVQDAVVFVERLGRFAEGVGAWSPTA